MAEAWFFCGIALASAGSWALGSILWRRLGDAITPAAMNLCKGLLGSLFLGACVLGSQAEPLPWRSAWFLAASGVIGIAVGDTFFFHALVRLGPRLTSLLGTLYPVAIALSATWLLGERPSLLAWAGILVTMAGVAWVLWERTAAHGAEAERARGIGYALLAVVSTTVAVLLAKLGVAAVPPMEAALIRLAAGTAGLLGWGWATRGLTGWLHPLQDGRLLAKVAGVVAVVVFGGFWLSLVALKHLDAAVAGTLNATSPLFVLPLARLLLKEKISSRSVFGTGLAVAGVGLILFG